MNENDTTRKSFDQLSFDIAGLPPLLRCLLEGKQVLTRLTAEDLREMSKFTELANVAGLAAHRVLRPAPAGLDPDAGGAPPGADDPRLMAAASELPGGVLKALGWALAQTPSLVIRGLLAGGAGRPFAAGAIVPQAQGAHLAQALARMMWELPEAETRLDYVLFIWPEALRRKDGALIEDRLVGHWPGERTGVVLGYDDLSLAAGMLLGAARRSWAAAGGRLIRAGEARETESAAQEDLLVEAEGRVAPVWANPLLAAGVLARSAAGRRAALAIGALPLGVEVDAEGHFPLFEGAAGGSAAGCVVVPRAALGSSRP